MRGGAQAIIRCIAHTLLLTRGDVTRCRCAGLKEEVGRLQLETTLRIARRSTSDNKRDESDQHYSESKTSQRHLETKPETRAGVSTGDDHTCHLWWAYVWRMSKSDKAAATVQHELSPEHQENKNTDQESQLQIQALEIAVAKQVLTLKLLCLLDYSTLMSQGLLQSQLTHRSEVKDLNKRLEALQQTLQALSARADAVQAENKQILQGLEDAVRRSKSQTKPKGLRSSGGGIGGSTAEEELTVAQRDLFTEKTASALLRSDLDTTR